MPIDMQSRVSIQRIQMVPMQIPPILKKAAKALLYSSACAAVYLSHARSLWLQYSVAVLTSSLIGLQGYHKKSLDASGDS
jgi:hypothetical protein